MRKAAFLIIAVMVSPAIADKVYLTDGITLSGTAKKIKGGYVELTDSDGNLTTFAKDSVKRVVFESTTSVADMLAMLDHLETLIAPAFGLGEPLQREFAGSRYFGRKTENTRPTHHTNRSIVHTGPIRRELVSNDTFVDDWVRYVARFDGIARMRTFKNVYKTKVRTRSLAEFARYPVEGREDLSRAVRDAIDSVKSVFDKAKRAKNVLNALRKAELKWDKRIRTAEDYARRLSADPEAKRQDRLLAQANIAKKRADKLSDIARMRLSGDDGTNLVAAGRIITLQLFEDVRRLSQPYLADSSDSHQP